MTPFVTLSNNWEEKIPAYLTEPFKGDFRSVGCLPELDPYSNLRNNEQVGPMTVLPQAISCYQNKAIYCYLDTQHYCFNLVLYNLSIFDAQTHIYVKNSKNTDIRNLQKKLPKLTFLDKPLDFSTELERYNIIVSNGTLNTCQAALAAGIPQLTLSKTLESTLISKQLQNLGVGKEIELHENHLVQPKIAELFNDESIKVNAQCVAKNIQSRYYGDIFIKTLAAAENLL